MSLTKKISPSLMCADFLHLGDELKTLSDCGIEYLHIDIMDGVFVQNYTLGTDFVRKLHECCDIPLDIHLMITEPHLKLDWFDLRPGDYVDLIGTFRFPDMRGDASLDMTTLTLLQNVKVLAIGPRWGRVVNMSSDPNMNASYSTVTVLLTPAEAEMIVFAQNKGTLTLSRRNFDDTFVTPDLPSVNFDYLQKNISNYNANRRSKVSFR